MNKPGEKRLDVAQVVEDTRALVRIDSQNPEPGESECAAWVADRLEAVGLRVQRQPVGFGRSNLVTGISGSGDAERLVILAHLDTVPVGGGWSYPALDAVIENGRVIGRGASDMKAGLATALNLARQLAVSNHRPSGDFVFCATVDEEGPEMAGAHALVADGMVTKQDQVLALEPTGLRLRIAQMGLRWLRLSISGKMAHAGRAHLGVDANHAMARVVNQLKAQFAELPHEDPLLGKPLVTCGRIEGGVATNVVPPSCSAELDVRLVPPMSVDDACVLVRATVESVLSDFPGASYELTPLGAARPPVSASESSKIVRRLRSAYRQVTGTEIGVGGADGHEAYTDASMVAALTGSKSCTVFGPGSSDVAHAADEYVAVADIDTAVRVMEEVVWGW